MTDDLHACRVTSKASDVYANFVHMEARLDDLLAGADRNLDKFDGIIESLQLMTERLLEMELRLSAMENAGGTRIAEIEAINADLLEALQPFADKCEEILAAAKRLDCPPERFSTAVLWEDLEKAGAATAKARET